MPTLAVARDEAFCFIYEESLDALRDEGIEIIEFSPVHDKELPANTSGLYLPGGYPELHAKELSENESMKNSIAAAIKGGIPTIAECGGFLYLQESITDADGNEYEMCAVLPGRSHMTERPVRFGYASMEAKTDGMLLKKGEHTNIHEFHYYESDHCGEDTHCVKPVSGREWDECYNTPSLYAGFPHLYLAGDRRLVERFRDAMIAGDRE